MTLQDLTTEQLDSLKGVVNNKVFRDLVASRADDILKFEWDLPVDDQKAMVRLAEAKGMRKAWLSLLSIDESIEEEMKIREEEKEKEDKEKKALASK